MKVEQFLNKNQFHLYGNGDGVHYLQSYSSLVVKISGKCCDPTIVLGRDWDYSTTTSKHVYAFLEEYAYMNFNGVSNKRAYINKLINNGVIKYDEEMH